MKDGKEGGGGRGGRGLLLCFRYGDSKNLAS